MASEDVGSVLESKKKLIRKVCSEAMEAHTMRSDKKFKVTTIESHVTFIFRGDWDLDRWYSKEKEPFGATKIDRERFPSLRRIGDDEAAIVNEAFQAEFISSVMTKLQQKVNDMRDNKPIVFSGHSSGGAMAVLATIWFLEQKAKQQDQTGSMPLCLTFGSPLVGNHIFSHALRREKWAGHFIHFVTRHDIVPRLFFAPRKPTSEQHFNSLLESIAPGSSRSRTPALALENLFMHVIGSALTLTSHVATKLMDSPNLLMETMTSFLDLSPYRPFGNYVFVRDSNKFVLLNNSEAVLQFLFFSCQPSDQEEAESFAAKIVGDHKAYSNRLQIDPWIIYGATGNDYGLRDVIQNSDQFGLSQRGELHLLAAAESEQQKLANLRKIESKIGSIKEEMKKIEHYKKTCRLKQIGYFDSFKQQKREDDFNTNVSRLALAGIWDEILEMLKSNKLPDDFESQSEWIKLGTEYRRLVEPLDIANYYRHLKNEDTGPYMGPPGKDRIPRPKRYRFPQKWLEHAKKVEKDSFGESNFWAELEELSLGNSQQIQNFDDRATGLQRNLLVWNEEKTIDDDVFLSESSFVKWWKLLEEKNKVPGFEKLVINE